MKKTILYIGALCFTVVGFATLTAFDDGGAAQTDEQKVTAAFDQLVADFNLAQEQACKDQALAEAQTQFGAENSASGISGNSTGNTGNTGTKKGTQKGGNENIGGGIKGGNENTNPITTKEEPVVDNTKKDPKKGKMDGNSGSTDDKKGKISGENKSTTTDKKKGKMGGGK